MTENKFKEGDRVRIASGPDNGGFGEVGDVGVVQFTCQNDCSVHFKTGSRSGESWYVAHKHLEPLAATYSNGNEDGTLTIREGGYYRTRDGRKVGPMEDGGEAHDTGETVLGAKVEGALRLWRAEGGKHLFGWDYLDLIAEWQDEPEPATSEPKFKVGDRVRVKGDPWREGHEGRAATIARIVDGYSPPAFTAVVDDTDGFDWFFVPDQLDAITTTPAIVARLDNGQPLPAARPHVHASVADASKEATRLARANPGREFAVYEMVHTVQREYEHEWMRLAAIGEKIRAIKEIRDLTGMTLKGAKNAVEHWQAVNAA